MARTYKTEWGALALKILPGFSIAFITFFAYREILGFFFTTRDALTLIDTSRVRSFHDIIRIFSEPLMNGTTFPHSYYRPISVLSYSLDYAVWRMTPFGYHLTDLVLHILVSIIVYSFLLRLSNKDRLTAWLGAVIFSIHPVLTQCVPGIAERQDILAAAFFLGSIWLFLIYLHKAQKSLLLASVVAYGLSLGSKEISVILPAVLVAYLTLVFNQADRPTKSIKTALITVLPYFIMTFALFAWRLYVLQGVGGKQGHPEPHVISVSIRTLLAYSSDLAYGLPQTLTAIYHLVPTAVTQAASVLIILSLIVILVMNKRFRFFSHVTSNLRDWTTVPAILLVLAASASLLGLLIYPLLSSPIMGLVTRTYEGQGPHFLAKVMNVSPMRPVQYYFDTFTGLVLTLLFLTLLFSIIILSLLRCHSRTGQTIWVRSNVRLISFLAVWLLLPLSLYILSATSFSHRYMYLPAVPCACIISLLFVGSAKSILARRATTNGLTFVDGSVFLVSVLLITSIFLNSPLVRPLDDWKKATQLSSIFLHKFSGLVATARLPDDSIVHLYHLPPGTSGIGCLADYTITSWLRLHEPANQMQVIVHSTAEPECFQGGLILSSEVDKEAKELRVDVTCT
jgi:hypothetical protein